ncbi:MAG: DUF87 domain-containing protein [Bdellovibrionales bacterium]|nr:DUF87 domain-containing protein [Bdellovibrionales bacterium]
MMNFFNIWKHKNRTNTLVDYWGVSRISEDGFIEKEHKMGFMFKLDGIDGTFLEDDQLMSLHREWRSALRMNPGEEIQIIFRKRVELQDWVEEQLKQSFLAENTYGRRILLDRLADHLMKISKDEPQILSQKIVVCFWCNKESDKEILKEKRSLIYSMLNVFSNRAYILNKTEILNEINISSQDLTCLDEQGLEWPEINIDASHIQINEEKFRALELQKLPENWTELGMIQALTLLPLPLDISVRLIAKDSRPIISSLEKKRNMLSSKKGYNKLPSAFVDSQLEQINEVLKSIAENSEGIFDFKMTIGIRVPKKLGAFQRKAMSTILRMSSQLFFCEFEECTLHTFDSYLECIPSFSGKNIQSHTVLGSNAIHFLPLFCTLRGDKRSIVSFTTLSDCVYSIDPVDNKLANYNWLITGTSGSGKSFFVNSLLSQSSSINPNIFIVDIGGSYNRLTQFLGGQVFSLDTNQGFEVSPFFISKCEDPKEERIRRQHIYQIFLEMTRVDGQLPPVDIRQLLSECLGKIFDMKELPVNPISYLLTMLQKINSDISLRLSLLLKPWKRESFNGQFVDTNKSLIKESSILTFDLKGLTEFEDLSRVVQLIICSSLWARIRQIDKEQFSWIVLDEVAFSLLKTQPLFVDELVSTVRKYYAGAVIVVQDLDKVTSSLAGSSILQNTDSKAILQQRGDPKNYSDVLSLRTTEQWAINSLQRKKGSFSDIFLIRSKERVMIRHKPSPLEYWLATSSPEDNMSIKNNLDYKGQDFQEKIIDFVERKKRGII